MKNSVRKTHRVIIVEECMRSGGIGASVSSWISENLLEDLDHEVIRLSSQDVPTAYAKLLEDGACRRPPPAARVAVRLYGAPTAPQPRLCPRRTW
jgi:pyruvate dehydrogenase E1 component beta subunit